MFWTAVNLLWLTLSFAAVVHLLMYKREPSSTIAWLFFVTIVPIFGPLIYFILGPQRLERNAIKRKSKLYSGRITPEQRVPRHLPEPEHTLFKLGRRISGYEGSAGNQIEILPVPSEALIAMNKAIAEAKTYIHLEYYIIASDEITEQLFDSLIAAQKRGVEVRILYDSFGSYSLKSRYFKRLRENGIKISGFLPLSLLPQRLNANFRNHRKILIVDGRIAFTGGANIGRVYLGRGVEKTWRDYSFRVVGPVCLQLEDVFAKDWQFTTQEDLSDAKYYPIPDPGDKGKAIMQVVESGPDTEFRILHLALLLAIHSAKGRVWLTTPYFIPDTAMVAALELAALRGVDVRLILPAKNDAPLVQLASRSFYEDLFRSGIRIFEYQPRILHAKTLVVDDEWTILGSGNMDIRSFRLNFELNLFVYDPQTNRQAAELFLQDLAESQEVSRAAYDQRPLYKRIAENAARLLSPIL